ncbi:hypothetical protein AMTRI_Chr01g128190 [Amborella trichopoda]
MHIPNSQENRPIFLSNCVVWGKNILLCLPFGGFHCTATEEKLKIDRDRKFDFPACWIRERGNSEMGSLSCTLPDDLMLNILSLLPIQSILNFKVISKSWNDILSSPSFATVHSFSPSPIFLTFTLFVDNKSKRIFSLPPPPQSFSLYPNDTRPQLRKHQPEDVSVRDMTANPTTCKYTVVPAAVNYSYLGVFGLGYWSHKNGCHRRWSLFSSLTRCWEIVEDPRLNSSPNLMAFDRNTKTWDSIPPPGGLSYPCSRLEHRILICRCHLRVQIWGDRVCVFNISHDLELKMWVLNRDMRNWELVLKAGLQNLKKFGCGLYPLILVGNTFFISRHIALVPRSRQFTIIEGLSLHIACLLVPYKSTLLSWDT